MPNPPYGGLSEAEALRRLQAEGPNELAAHNTRTTLRVALEVAREPMFVLLIAAAALYFTMGELGDALILLGSVVLVMIITIVQERRTEHALDALRELASPRALVVRDGQQRRIPGRDVVRGDIVLLNEGDRVPADALLRVSSSLAADESLLTGESVPVDKRPSATQQQLDPPGGDNLVSLFSGTLVTRGQGLAEVICTGPRTAFGAIGRSLQAIEPQATPLQIETGRLVRRLAAAGLIACFVTVVAYGLTRGNSWQSWRQGSLAGIAMAMSLLPEELPVILTIFLALGAWRISRSRVLTRRMPVIETLGAATVLCVDKTGTLTQNRMQLRVVATPTGALDPGAQPGRLPASHLAVLRAAILASRRDPFDPMERALLAEGEQALGAGELSAADEILRDYPLSTDLAAMSHARSAGGDRVEVATKGAPEAVLGLCELQPGERARVLGQVSELAARGLRVLAVALATAPARELPAEHHLLRTTFLGLVAFEDPLRESVPAAVASCRTAGIRVVMITGDYPETARSIARQAGIAGCDSLMTGAQLAGLGDAELAERIGGIQVFARIVPEQKLRIVSALQRNGEIVAMTGDGVNDAPALKAADIGLAMGARGTDVAREAASLVLLDDDFASIVSAIRLGRQIFDNIKKAVVFTMAVHVPIAGLSILPVFIPGWPLLLLPVHIAFLELIIDPTCTLVFEAEAAEQDIMLRRPRNPRERLFSRQALALALLQGLSVLVVCTVIVALALPTYGANIARSLAFAALVAAFLTIILVNRSWTVSLWRMLAAPNRALWWVVGLTAVLLALVLGLPMLQRLFSFGPVRGRDLALSIAASIGGLLWFEVLKARSKRAAGGASA